MRSLNTVRANAASRTDLLNFYDDSVCCGCDQHIKVTGGTKITNVSGLICFITLNDSYICMQRSFKDVFLSSNFDDRLLVSTVDIDKRIAFFYDRAADSGRC